MGNFRIEPPGLFRGRGEHPKMGKIKKRIYPRDVTINIGEGVPIPQHPYPGEPARQLAGRSQWQVASAGCNGRSKLRLCALLHAKHGRDAVWHSGLAESLTTSQQPRQQRSWRLPNWSTPRPPALALPGTCGSRLDAACCTCLLNLPATPGCRPELEGGTARQDGHMAGLLA